MLEDVFFAKNWYYSIISGRELQNRVNFVNRGNFSFFFSGMSTDRMWVMRMIFIFSLLYMWPSGKSGLHLGEKWDTYVIWLVLISIGFGLREENIVLHN